MMNEEALPVENRILPVTVLDKKIRILNLVLQYSDFDIFGQILSDCEEASS